MTNIADVVKVSVTAASGALAREGFGLPMIMAYHTKTANRVFEVAASAELADYGFASDHPLYTALNILFSQDPRPSTVKVGRLANAPTQVVAITILVATPGEVLKIQLNETTEIAYTVLPAATPTTVAAALAPLFLAAVPGCGAVAALGVITCTTAANGVTRFRGWNPRVFSFKSGGTDPGLAADLAAIYAEDQGFTGFDLLQSNELEVKAAALWAEANQKLYFPTCFDTEMRDSVVTTDVASDLKALLYQNTMVSYSGKDTHSYRGIALFGRLGAQFAPGGETFAHKQVVGVVADDSKSLFTSELNALTAKNANVYFPVFSKAITWEGKAVNGKYIDERRFLFWQAYDLAISVFEFISNQPGKLTYDNEGRQGLIMQAELSMVRGQDSKGWTKDKDKPITVVAPEVSSLSTAQKASRAFPSITCRAYLAGAIHASTFVIEAAL